jgi:ParB-like chromosome segregation protein Spo0J
MKRKSGYSLIDDYATITKQLDKGKQPTEQPTVLPLASIKLWPKVFQHRGFAGSESKGHVLRLTAAIKKSKSHMLDPITVWWDGNAWACVDGHHRHDAYTAAELGSAHLVPVQVFEGTLGQAMALAAMENTKDKLAMSSREKSNTAWRLVAMTDMTKSETAKAACVSESLVSAMRRVVIKLDAEISDAANDLSRSAYSEFRELNWADAKRLSEGRDAADFDHDEVSEKKAQEMALSLRKALGPTGGAKNLEVFARALEIYDSRLPDLLADWWRILDDEEEEVTEF